MAGFVLSGKVFTTIVTHLAFSPALRACQDKFNLPDIEARQDFAQLLMLLNCRAVDDRYGTGFSRLYRTSEYQYEDLHEENPTACYNALRCFLMAGWGTRTARNSPTFLLLDQCARILAQHLYSLPGIPDGPLQPTYSERIN